MEGPDQRDKIAALSMLKGKAQTPQDAAGEEMYPTLMSCLLPVWKDGKCKRQSGSLRLRIVGGFFLLTIHCPTEGMEATLTATSVVNLLEAMEDSLQSDRLEWIPDFESQKKARRVRID